VSWYGGIVFQVEWMGMYVHYAGRDHGHVVIIMSGGSKHLTSAFMKTQIQYRAKNIKPNPNPRHRLVLCINTLKMPLDSNLL
jgi:hypothetical protein